MKDFGKELITQGIMHGEGVYFYRFWSPAGKQNMSMAGLAQLGHKTLKFLGGLHRLKNLLR
jgi:hypothetical protein